MSAPYDLAVCVHCGGKLSEDEAEHAPHDTCEDCCWTYGKLQREREGL